MRVKILNAVSTIKLEEAINDFLSQHNFTKVDVKVIQSSIKFGDKWVATIQYEK